MTSKKKYGKLTQIYSLNEKKNYKNKIKSLSQ